MGSFWRGVGLALAVLALAAGASSADAIGPAVAGPQWGSDQIRAARSLQPVEAIRFRLHRVRVGAGGRKTASDSEVVLAPDFTFVRTGGQSTLYDHALCRWLVWPAPTGGLSNVNCHALPYFFAVETQNRIAQDKALPEAARPMAAYGAETELHISRGGTTLTRSAVKDGTDYAVAGRTVAHVRGDVGALKAEEATRLVRLLALATPVHPEMRRDLAALAHAPGVIELEALGPGQGERETLSFSKIERIKAAYPLPPGLKPEIDGANWTRDKAMAEAVSTAAAVLRDPAAHPAPSAASLLTGLTSAEATRAPVAVFLRYRALAQLHPRVLSTPEGKAVAPVLTTVLKDPRAAALADASRLAGDARAQGDRQAAARTLLDTPVADDLVDFRDISLGNLMLNSPGLDQWDTALRARLPDTATTLFWRSAAQAPWASATWHDAGLALLTEQRVDLGWMAFDLGRAIDPEGRGGLMTSITGVERRLEQALPDMF